MGQGAGGGTPQRPVLYRLLLVQYLIGQLTYLGRMYVTQGGWRESVFAIALPGVYHRRNPHDHFPGIMNKKTQGALFLGALFMLTACAAQGPVGDKRAPGEIGHKTYQIQVNDEGVNGPHEIWVTVTEKQWDKCSLRETYPSCTRK